MSKLFGNKKVMLGIISVMVGVTVLMAGLTYAWFTNSGSATRDDISMGTLKMNVTLKNADMFSVDEPGGAFGDQVAYIQNLGTVPVFAKLNFTATTTIKSDSNGDPLSTWYTIENDPKVAITLQEDGFEIEGNEGVPLGQWISADGEYHFWYKYKGEYYVLMSITIDDTGAHPHPGKIVPFNYTVELSKDMGNEYQNADVDIKVDWTATQGMADESFPELFGIAAEDLENNGFFNNPEYLIGGGSRYIMLDDYLK